MNMIQVLKRIANTSVNTFSLAIMSIRPLFEEICIGKAKSRTYRAPGQERVKSLLLPDYLTRLLGEGGPDPGLLIGRGGRTLRPHSNLFMNQAERGFARSMMVGPPCL